MTTNTEKASSSLACNELVEKLKTILRSGRRAGWLRSDEYATIQQAMLALTPAAPERNEIYCHACSLAGGGDTPIYHLPPACGAATPAATGTIDLAKAREVATQNVGPYDAALARSAMMHNEITPEMVKAALVWGLHTGTVERGSFERVAVSGAFDFNTIAQYLTDRLRLAPPRVEQSADVPPTSGNNKAAFEKWFAEWIGEECGIETFDSLRRMRLTYKDLVHAGWSAATSSASERKEKREPPIDFTDPNNEDAVI